MSKALITDRTGRSNAARAVDHASREAGAVLSKKNRTALQFAFDTITSVLADAGVIPKPTTEEDDQDDDETAKDKEAPKTAAKTGSKEDNSRAKEARPVDRSSRAIAEAAGFSVSDLATLLQNALNDTVEAPRDGSYSVPLRITDIFDNYFVYCVGWSGTEYYRVDYSVANDGTVTLSPPTYVNRKVTYIAPAITDESMSEAGVSCAIGDDFSRLVEAAIGNDGSTLIKLISPGLGSSGYYSPEVLSRDGAKAFPRGTKMYIDHDTLAEEASRPEGTITRLAGVLEEDARYIGDHRAGAGLYARATVFEGYRDDLNQIADWIGTSIRADGQARTGEYNGARVPIITSIKPSNGVNNRVDFVTVPGAGGRVLSLFESARKRQPEDRQANEEGVQEMTEEQIRQIVTEGIAAGIREAITPLSTEVARMREAATLRDARSFADRTLSGPKYATLPATTRERIAGTVALNAPLTESGALDGAKLVEAIEAAAKEEATYLSTATGRTFQLGLGESRSADNPAIGDGHENGGEDEMTAIFERWGLSADSAKVAAAGRC